MRARRAKEIGLLAAVLLLTGVAFLPLLRADPPCTHDGGLHYFRVVAMRHALDDGLSLSRWIPDLAFGYGYPFFNYRAASSYYLGLALYLVGLPLPLALNLVYVLSLAGAAVGSYLLGRDLFGRWAGVVAAVAYVYAPYSFIDALTRGNMPESAALALFPFILWTFRRLLLSGQTRYLLASAASLALLWLTHNISSLLFTPFLALYLPLVWLARGRRGHLVSAGLALALGVGLTAFFWAPAVLEKGEVQLHLSRTTRNNDYHYNFVNLSEVLAPPEPADPALLNPPLRLPVGLSLAILALLGTVLALWRWRPFPRIPNPESRIPNPEYPMLNTERWASVVFFALASITMIFMATRASLPLWENLPLISFVQFPWRFVGRAVLPLSLLAAAPIPNHLHCAQAQVIQYPISNTHYLARLSWLPVPLIASLLILTALPLTYPPTGYCPTEPRPDILDLFAYERNTGLVGVDPEGSYFPVTVQSRPTGSPLEAQYAAILSGGDRNPIARFDEAGLPEGAVVHRAEYAPNYARLEIETPRAVRARYFAFAFPGWHVQIDGRPADIVPSQPEGLITFDLPAGRHVVEVDWRSTPIRAGATMLSVLALASVAFIAYTAARSYFAQRVRVASSARSASQLQTFVTTAALTWMRVGALVLLALALLIFKLLLVDRTSTFFRRSGLRTDGTLPGVNVPLDARYDDGVRLLGYDRNVETIPADGTLHLAFYWSAYARPSRSYKSTVALLGPDGQLWSAKNALPRRGYAELPPSPAWGDGRYAVEGLDVEPLPGTPPGRYELLLTAFDRETLAPLQVLEVGRTLGDLGPSVGGPNLVVGQVTLTRPGHSPDPADVPMQMHLESDMGALTLLGANLDRSEAAPGDPALVTLFWEAVGDEAQPDFQVHLALINEAGVEAMVWQLPPVRDDWPTDLWRPGDLWRGQHLLRLPARLESGDYTWRLQLYQATSPFSYEGQADLGRLHVNAPQRLWQAPPLEVPLDAELGGQVKLLGANLSPAAAISTGSLTVTLAWQAQVEMTTSYRVFVHLLKPDGGVLAQSDGEPAGWTRPTTGWAPGEVVLDERVLALPADAPPGRYTLVAGLYDPDTGRRLATPDGTDAILLTPLTLEKP